MAKYLLTERFVDNITPKGTPRFPPDYSGRIEISDLRVEGLCLRVTKRGHKSWSFVYRVQEKKGDFMRAGPQRRITMGTYPGLTLRQARDVALDFRDDIMAGVDPSNRKPEPVPTVEEVCNLYHTKSLVGRLKDPDQIIRRMEIHVLPDWGDKPITELTRGDVHTILDNVKFSTGVGAAREVKKSLHAMFVWAVDREIVAVNPLYRMRRDDLAATRDVRRPLTDPQIREVWNLHLPRVAPQLRVLLLTGCRKVEFGTGCWDQVDWDECLFTIPADRHKGKRDTIIPLSRPAIEILKTVPKRGKKIFDRYLESGSLGPAHRRLSFHLRPHDLRATVATRMGQLGIQPNVIQLCLGQSVSGLLSVYNKHAYLDERRAAFELYGEHIMEVVGDG